MKSHFAERSGTTKGNKQISFLIPCSSEAKQMTIPTSFPFVLLLTCIGASFAQQLSLFVSVESGSDVTGNGAMGNPFQSITAAQLYIRSNITKSAYSEIFVEILGGLYFLSTPLSFTAQDSGTTTTHITYRAYNDEEVRLIGGVAIGGWTSVTDTAVLSRLKDSAKTNVIVASLGSLDPGYLIRRGFFSGGSNNAAMELFFKTEPMTLARYPNDDFLVVSTYNNVSTTVSFDSKTNNVPKWQLEADPWAFGFWFHDWADDFISINEIANIGGSNVSFVTKSPTSYGIRSGQRFYVQNFLSELDSPGEYYIDRNNSKIYFWPPSTDYTQNDFIVSVGSVVVSLTNVAYFTLDGLVIEAPRTIVSFCTFPSMELTLHQCLTGYNLRNVTFSGLTVRNSGTHGMSISGPENILVERCLVSGIGNSGIRLVGGTRANLTRSNHIARNNVVRHFSRFAKTYQPAFYIDGVGITIENNEMFDGPHTALLWYGNNHTLQYNIVHHVCKETGDVGAFYSGRDWTRRGTVIRHNLFYNITGPGAFGASGVYFDDQYSSGSIYGNIFYNVYRGILLGGGRDSDIFNNIFIGSDVAVYVDARGKGICGPSDNETLMDSLAAVPYRSELWRQAFPTLYTILDNDPHTPSGNRIGTNIFINNTRNHFLCGSFNYTGHVEILPSCVNLTRADFANVNGLDFNLQAGALSRCGSSFASDFEEIPFDKIGVVPPEGSTTPSNSPGNPASPSSVGVSGAAGLDVHLIGFVALALSYAL